MKSEISFTWSEDSDDSSIFYSDDDERYIQLKKANMTENKNKNSTLNINNNSNTIKNTVNNSIKCINKNDCTNSNNSDNTHNDNDNLKNKSCYNESVTNNIKSDSKLKHLIGILEKIDKKDNKIHKENDKNSDYTNNNIKENTNINMSYNNSEKKDNINSNGIEYVASKKIDKSTEFKIDTIKPDVNNVNKEYKSYIGEIFSVESDTIQSKYKTINNPNSIYCEEKQNNNNSNINPYNTTFNNNKEFYQNTDNKHDNKYDNKNENKSDVLSELKKVAHTIKLNHQLKKVVSLKLLKFNNQQQ